MAIIFTDEVQKRCPFRGSIPRPLHMRMRNKGERRQGAASLTHLGVGYGDAEIKVHGRHDAALELELAKLSQWGSVRQGSILGSCACAAGSRSTKNPRRFPPCISIFPRHKSIAGGRAQHRGRFSTHLDRANLMEADHELLDCSRHLFTFPAELTLKFAEFQGEPNRFRKQTATPNSGAWGFVPPCWRRSTLLRRSELPKCLSCRHLDQLPGLEKHRTQIGTWSPKTWDGEFVAQKRVRPGPLCCQETSLERDREGGRDNIMSGSGSDGEDSPVNQIGSRSRMTMDDLDAAPVSTASMPAMGLKESDVGTGTAYYATMPANSSAGSLVEERESTSSSSKRSLKSAGRMVGIVSTATHIRKPVPRQRSKDGGAYLDHTLPDSKRKMTVQEAIDYFGGNGEAHGTLALHCCHSKRHRLCPERWREEESACMLCCP